MGFRAGDANLYRFVGNDPTNSIDPTGLAEKKITSISTAFSEDYTKEEADAVQQRLKEALQRLEKAESMLTIQWDRLKEGMTIDLRDEAGPHIPNLKLFNTIKTGTYRINIAGGDYPRVYADSAESRKDRTYREFYLARIRTVLDYVRTGNTVKFRYDRKAWNPDAERYTRAYVKHIFYSLGNPIYLTQGYYDEQSDVGRASLIRHELGRWAGFDGSPAYENTGDYLNDVYQWDTVIDHLANAYDRLQQADKKK
jgi:hypothetical protein